MNTPKLIEEIVANEAIPYMEKYHEKLLAASTTGSRKYCSKCMSRLCERFPFLRNIWEYCEKTFLLVNRWVKHSATQLQRAFGEQVVWKCQPLADGVNQFYVIDLLTADGELKWSKIGTTTRETWRRMSEHLNYYKRYGVEKIVVNRVYDCTNIDAETFEDVFRTYFKRFFGREHFQPNDRFDVKIDCAITDKLFTNTMKEERDFQPFSA